MSSSRIPIPTTHSSPTPLRTGPTPDHHRAPSPLPPLRTQSTTSASTAPMSSVSGQLGSAVDTRRKQSKRDEAIRKKIESELSRKRTISTHQPSRGKKPSVGKSSAAKGTVAALKPSPALTVPETITVADASQLCAAKRTDCVLVVDDEEGLSGIFTAKDLAFRVTAEGLDPRTTPVSAIMTPNPMVTRDTTSATEALQLMVQRHFRHLPVCNEEGNVVGLLDITKVFHEALDKMERGSSASAKLYSALEGVQSELGGGLAANPQAAAMLAYVEALREKTALPDLTTVMDAHTQPATVGPRTTVRDAARLMKENRTTAVCVMEGGTNTNHPNGALNGPPAKIVGIFTSKDIVLRVIAAGLDPGRCSVVRVMTPHPDVAAPTLSVHDALKKMYVGHYLNLPVVENDGRLVAIVDVLKLTYATLEQINSLSADTAQEGEAGGPLWGRFFDSLGAQDDTESVMSAGPHPGGPMTPSSVRPYLPHLTDPMMGHPSPQSDVYPGDSASVVEDEVHAFPSLHGPPSSIGGGNHSVAAPPPPVDDGTYVFKFRTPSGRTHRFQARKDDFENLREIVSGKLALDPFFAATGEADPLDYVLAYTDSDGDTVLMTTDSDLIDAVEIAKKAHVDRVVLFCQGGRGWENAKPVVEETPAPVPVLVAPAPVASPPPQPQAAPPAEVHVPPQQIEPNLKEKRQATSAAEDLVMGIPKDMVIPASIGFLGAVIVTVFIASRIWK